MDEQDCRRFLMDELAQRQNKNAIYSLRAFARDLGIGSTSLSDFLACKRRLSKTSLKKVASNLGLSPLLADKMYGNSKLSSVALERTYLQEDAFRLIADWYYFAILNLAKIKTNRSSKNWVARRLGISEIQAQMAVSRLQRLGFIEIKSARMIRTTKPLSTTREIASRAIQKHHSDQLKIAEATLREVPVKMREFSSVTMAVNTKKLPEVKEILMKTKRRVEKILEAGGLDEVYNLSFQLYPLSHSPKTRNSLK